MNSEYTQQQSLDGLERAEQLSLQTALPPAEIKGYKLEKLLGQGAFGQVWLGKDLNTGREVAIKFYLYRGGVNFELLNHEVKHLVNMSTGRYIVQVLGVGWDEEPPYYVMEYLENGSLEDMVRARGALSIPLTVSMMREIAEGLSFAHGRGVLHCDLKPANVMLDHDCRPRLADFGQSRMSNEQTPSLGTLFFMAPEQADLEASPDARWDVYALGAIAYCMLVGSPPYRTPEIVETLDTAESLNDRLVRYRETIHHAARPKLHYRRRNIDKALCQIIDRCLAVHPEERFANVEQVLKAIDERHEARVRRPLYLLGILAPILFTLLMLVFSARSIGVAKRESLQRAQQLSMESSKLASLFAAGTLEREIAALFRLVESEAERDELRGLMLSATEAGRAQLATIADGAEHPQEREQLRQIPEQKRLEEHIQLRLNEMVAQEAAGSGHTVLNSLFVNDAQGTNLAIDFADSKEVLSQSPVGRNFAYRSYFNGARSDGSQTTPRSKYRPTRTPHLSASFRSTSTGKWKVGISAPVWRSDEDASQESKQPIGVLVLTINLGDFELLAAEDVREQHNRFAVLVDGRAGNGQGTLLQHPFLRALEGSRSSAKLPVPQINPQLLTRLKSTSGIVDYRDPAADAPQGEIYDGEWIAAMQQVHLPKQDGNDADDRSKSDLWVLVQVRGATVAEPVTQLGSRLQRETYIALGSLLVVMLVLWFFVFRQSQSGHSALESLPAVSPDSPYQSTINSGHRT